MVFEGASQAMMPVQKHVLGLTRPVLASEDYGHVSSDLLSRDRPGSGNESLSRANHATITQSNFGLNHTYDNMTTVKEGSYEAT